MQVLQPLPDMLYSPMLPNAHNTQQSISPQLIHVHSPYGGPMMHPGMDFHQLLHPDYAQMQQTLAVPNQLNVSTPKKKRRSPSLYIPPEFVAWLHEYYVINPEESVPKDSIYRRYCIFCREHEMAPKKSNIFGKMLKKIFPNIRPRRLGSAGNMVAHYAGIALRVPMLSGEDSYPASPSDFLEGSSSEPSSGPSSPLSRSLNTSPMMGESSADPSPACSPSIGYGPHASPHAFAPTIFGATLARDDSSLARPRAVSPPLAPTITLTPVGCAHGGGDPSFINPQSQIFYTVTPPAPPQPGAYPTYYQPYVHHPITPQLQALPQQYIMQHQHQGVSQQAYVPLQQMQAPLSAPSSPFAMQRLFEEIKEESEEEITNTTLLVPFSSDGTKWAHCADFAASAHVDTKDATVKMESNIAPAFDASSSSSFGKLFGPPGDQCAYKLEMECQPDTLSTPGTFDGFMQFQQHDEVARYFANTPFGSIGLSHPPSSGPDPFGSLGFDSQDKYTDSSSIYHMGTTTASSTTEAIFDCTDRLGPQLFSHSQPNCI